VRRNFQVSKLEINGGFDVRLLSTISENRNSDTLTDKRKSKIPKRRMPIRKSEWL